MSNGASITTGATPKIVIEQIGGDLRLSGWDQQQVTLMQESEIELHSDGETVYVQGNDDCTLYVPKGATITIKTIHGDAAVNTLLGEFQAATIHGDARLHELGNVTLGQIGGDLSVRQVTGDLQVENAGGDVRVAEVTGNCRVSGGGDLHIDQVYGNLKANGGGDGALRLILQPGTTAAINVGGDLACQLPEQASVQIKASCGGDIRAKRLPLSSRRTEHHLNATLGDGEATLQLHCGGDIRLIGQREEGASEERGFGEDFGADFEFQANEFAQQVIGQVEQQMAQLARHLDQRLAHFGNDEEFASRVQEKVQNAMRRAEEKMSEVMRRTEERMRAAEERAARHSERRQPPQWRPPVPAQPPHATRPMPPQPPVPSQTQPAPIDDEERRTILRMVSEGKITVEQADQLLTALINPTGAQTKV